MKQKKEIIEEIQTQKNEYYIWQNGLKEYLSNNHNKEIEVFIISNQWLKKYIATFFNQNNMNLDEIVSQYNNFESINNEKLFFLKNFDDLPNIFILNYKTWNSLLKNNKNALELKIKAKLENNIVFFKYNNYDVNFYCLFFLDQNKMIRQSYIKIKNKEKENEILNNIKLNGVIKFLEKNKIIIDEHKFKSNLNNLDIIISECFQNNKNNFNKKLFNSTKEKSKKIKYCKQIEINDEIYRKFINTQKNGKKFIKISNKNNNNNQKNKVKTEIKENLFKTDNLEKFNPKKIIVHNKRFSSSPQKSFRKSNNYNFNLNILPYFKAIHKESIPGIIGLKSIDEIEKTCYLNSIIQCFSNIVRLRNELLNEDIYLDLEKNKSTKKLSFAVAEIFKNLWKNLKNRMFSPNKFQEIIFQMENNLNENKNLIILLLENMHKELNKVNDYNIIYNNENYIIDNNNINEVLNNFLKNYSNKNNSIISSEFCGYLNNWVHCPSCNRNFFKIEIFNILIFPLQNIKYFMEYKGNFIRINDCFDYNQNIEIIESFYCYYCSQNTRVFHYKKILYAPKSLIIYLNRESENGFHINVIFEEYLNIRKYIVTNNGNFMYELVGVISQEGSCKKGNHFIAYCKNSDNCGWYKYNNENVYRTTFHEMRENCLPYALFYSYIQA